MVYCRFTDLDGNCEVYVVDDRYSDGWTTKVAKTPNDRRDAGRTFSHATPGECADNLERLVTEGFVVPQHAIDRLRGEQSVLEQHFLSKLAEMRGQS